MLSGEGEPCGQRPGELYLGAWLIGDANCNCSEIPQHQGGQGAWGTASQGAEGGV